MGNGAPVQGAAASSRGHDFATVESLARKGYFNQHHDEYCRALQQAIRMNELDVLEVLIPAGNTKLALPLHMAASAGNVEACELLLSAGFSWVASDSQGRTPLHLCAMNQSGTADASVCITLLGLVGSKAVNMRDRQGCTPLHCAASLNNVDAVRWLLDVKGINVKLANGDGHTARDIARRRGFPQVTELLDVKDGTLKEGSSKVMQSINAKSRSASRGDVKVDQERIMKVWEAFFENAFKNMEAEASAGLMFDDRGVSKAQKKVKAQYYGALCGDDDSDDDDGPYHAHAAAKPPPQGGLKRVDQQSTATATVAPAKMSAVKSATGSKKTPANDPYDPYGGYYDGYGTQAAAPPATATATASAKKPEAEEWVKPAAGGAVAADPGVLAWYQYVCCFEPTNNCLYTVNVHDGTSSWLEDHLAYHQYWYGLIPDAWLEDVDAYLSLPTDCALSVRCGWITYYDSTSNECCWYNIPSTHSLSCLPVGYDPLCDSDEGQALGLTPYEGSEEWRSCPHAWTLRHSWVAVVIDDDAYSGSGSGGGSGSGSGSGGGAQYYFLNQITGFTSWHAPEGWDEMVRDHWAGWVLCMAESSEWALYWWNPATSESVWVEA